jgi:hypothetical protein
MNMKKILAGLIFLSLLLVVVVPVEAKTIKVKSYYKPSTGQYINSHFKTSPNKTRIDNFSTKGNYNPYTGKSGTRSPYKW